MSESVPLRNGVYIKVGDLSIESLAYINAESARWGLPPSRLASLIIKVVCDDRMIQAVLDEDKIAELIPNKAKRKRLYQRRRN